MERAIPFITFDEKKGFMMNPDAEELLKSLKEKLGVISIVGKYRTGKSFFVNRVLLNRRKDGFNVGPTINPCTKGLWLWTKTLKSENPEFEDMTVLLIDTEGFGGIDENVNHDSRIFLFSLLLSSYFIYNSVGTIDETALQNISLLINLAKDIQIKSAAGGAESEEEIAQYFPSFHWIVRDFSLRIVDQAGNSITPKEYLDNALAPQKGVSDQIESKNRIRRMLKCFFKDRDCSVMVRPLESEKDLQKLDELDEMFFRQEFIDQAKQIRKKIFKKIRPKALNGKMLTGPMLLELSRAYITAVNKGSVPNIETAWVYLCKNESIKALENSLSIMDTRLASLQVSDSKELKALGSQLREELVNNFRKSALGEEQELRTFYTELDKKFEERFRSFKEKTKENLKGSYQTYLDEKYVDLERTVADGGFKTIYDFQEKLTLVRKEYLSKFPESKLKGEVFHEFSEKCIMMASEFFIKKSELELLKETKLNQQRITMLENDKSTIQKDAERDKEDLRSRIQDLDRERASCKVAESTLIEKLAVMKADKERIEANIQEMQSSYKTKEEVLEKTFKEKLTAVESQSDTMKTEFLWKNTESEKERALLTQRLELSRKEIESLHAKCSTLETENRKLHTEKNQLHSLSEDLKLRVTHLESAKQTEVSDLRSNLEHRTQEYRSECDKVKEMLHGKNQLMLEKNYLENEIHFLKNQMEENKRMNEALISTIQQGLQSQFNEQKQELMQNNRNLAATVETLEIKSRALEEKNEKLKQIKKMVKHAMSLQCMYCMRCISQALFLNHLSTCSVLASKAKNAEDARLLTLEDGPTNGEPFISINQTMVKEKEEAKPYTEYVIQVRLRPGCEWNVVRKYKMFYELHQNIMSAFPGLDIPPSMFSLFSSSSSLKSMLMSKKTTVIEERRKALQQYLRDLAKIDVVRNSQIFRDFLDFDRNLTVIGTGLTPGQGASNTDETGFIGRKSGFKEGSPNLFACDEEISLPTVNNKENRLTGGGTSQRVATAGSTEHRSHERLNIVVDDFTRDSPRGGQQKNWMEPIKSGAKAVTQQDHSNLDISAPNAKAAQLTENNIRDKIGPNRESFHGVLDDSKGLGTEISARPQTSPLEPANFQSHRGTGADPASKKKKAAVETKPSANESKNFIKSLHYAMLSSPVLGKPVGK